MSRVCSICDRSVRAPPGALRYWFWLVFFFFSFFGICRGSCGHCGKFDAPGRGVRAARSDWVRQPLTLMNHKPHTQPRKRTATPPQWCTAHQLAGAWLWPLEVERGCLRARRNLDVGGAHELVVAVVAGLHLLAHDALLVLVARLRLVQARPRPRPRVRGGGRRGGGGGAQWGRRRRRGGRGRGGVSVRRRSADLDRHVRVVVELGADLVRVRVRVRVMVRVRVRARGQCRPSRS